MLDDIVDLAMGAMLVLSAVACLLFAALMCAVLYRAIVWVL